MSLYLRTSAISYAPLIRSLLRVSKRMYAESVPIALSVNIYHWHKPSTLASTPSLLGARLDNIRRLFLPHWVLIAIAEYQRSPGQEVDSIKQFLPRRLTHIVVDAYGRDCEYKIVRGKRRGRSRWVNLLLDLQKFMNVKLQILQFDDSSIGRTATLENVFPGCVQARKVLNFGHDRQEVFW